MYTSLNDHPSTDTYVTKMKGSMLSVEDLEVFYGKTRVIKGVSFQVEEGQWFMMAGPNGAGKSTIINAVSQGCVYNGTIRYQGRDIRSFKPRQLAREIAVLSQNHFVGYDFTVREVVGLGRYARSEGFLSGKDEEYDARISQALTMTGMDSLADQSVLKLSGGELKRTFLAQVFAQDPNILILDEPTNHLDPVYQEQILSLVRDWLTVPGRAVISVVHDLSIARFYGSHGLLLRDGTVLCAGEAEQIFSDSNLEAAFSMDVSGWMRRLLQQW